jgi:sirohydrochlorin ferrochelatase
LDRTALIVAHGQPSDPDRAEADLGRLAEAVAALLPGWKVGSATLAAPGRLDAAIRDLGRPLIFPFFMAGGWFTLTELPRRLRRAGLDAPRVLPAFGLMDDVAALAIDAVRSAVSGRGWRIEDGIAVLAAHGSGRSRAPGRDAARIADAVRAALPLGEVRLGFIEQEPTVQAAAADAGEMSVCLPLFVARWGHVETDIPAALAAAGFRGPCLAPLGARPEVPDIIARAMQRAG